MVSQPNENNFLIRNISIFCKATWTLFWNIASIKLTRVNSNELRKDLDHHRKSGNVQIEVGKFTLKTSKFGRKELQLMLVRISNCLKMVVVCVKCEN